MTTNIKTWEKEPRSAQWVQITWQWSDGPRPSYPNIGGRWGLSWETEKKRLSEEAFSKRTHTCLVPPQDSWARGFCSEECPCWSYGCCIYETPTRRSLSNLWLRGERGGHCYCSSKKMEDKGYKRGRNSKRRPMTGTAFQQLCVIRVCHSRWGSIRTWSCMVRKVSLGRLRMSYQDGQNQPLLKISFLKVFLCELITLWNHHCSYTYCYLTFCFTIYFNSIKNILNDGLLI